MLDKIIKSHIWKKNKIMCVLHLNKILTRSVSYVFTCYKCDVLKEEIVCIQLGVWFLHHKFQVTLICFFEILYTYVFIFFQLWLYKYLDISVTHVYVLSSDRIVVKGILPCTFPWCWPAWSQSCDVLQDFLPRAAGIIILVLVKASAHQSFSSLPSLLCNF